MVTSRFPRESSRMPAPASGLERWLPTVLTAFSVAVGAWLATEWFWHFSGISAASRPAGSAPSKPRLNMAGSAETLASSQLFGAPKTAVSAPAQVTSLNIKLKGVFAGDPARPAFAIINTGSRDEFALAGRELMPGVMLDSVHATHVLLKRNGNVERVNLEERSLASSGAGARPSPIMMAPRPSQRIPPPAAPPQPPQTGQPGQPEQPMQQPGGPPASINIEGINPQANQNFGRVGMRPDGVAVETAPPGSVLASLGLQAGDVIRSVNGQAVTSEADLARVYQQAASSPSVQAEITRDGKTFPVQVRLRR